MTRLSAKYFTDDELKCKCGCDILNLDITFDAELYDLRKAFAQPMTITSCCRCKKHNEAVGGAKMSFHIADSPAWRRLTGCAAIDVKYSSKEYRDTLARLAYYKGWRVGYSKTFLHLDIAAVKRIKPKSVFKYANVSDAEFDEFKQIIKG